MRVANQTRARLVEADAGVRIATCDQLGMFTNDLDYWACEATRIEKAAETIDYLTDDSDLATARTTFTAATPGVRDFRNSATHRDDPKFIPNLICFAASAVEIRPGGRVRYLVDPCHQDHDALHAINMIA